MRVLAYLFIPYLVFFTSFFMMVRWWTALIEIGAFGLIAWKFAEHHDRHHEAEKFLSAYSHVRQSEAMDRYVETYGVLRED